MSSVILASWPFYYQGTITSTHLVQSWVGPRSGPDVEKKGRLLPLLYLYRAAGLQLTLRYSIPWFVSALPYLSPHLNGVPNGTPLAAVGAVFSCPYSNVTLWCLWTNCSVNSTSHSELSGTSSNAAVPYYVSTLILPLVRDTFWGSLNSSCEWEVWNARYNWKNVPVTSQ